MVRLLLCVWASIIVSAPVVRLMEPRGSIRSASAEELKSVRGGKYTCEKLSSANCPSVLGTYNCANCVGQQCGFTCDNNNGSTYKAQAQPTYCTSTPICCTPECTNGSRSTNCVITYSCWRCKNINNHMFCIFNPQVGGTPSCCVVESYVTDCKCPDCTL
jgi:hypothetical protein